MNGLKSDELLYRLNNQILISKRAKRGHDDLNDFENKLEQLKNQFQTNCGKI